MDQYKTDSKNNAAEWDKIKKAVFDSPFSKVMEVKVINASPIKVTDEGLSSLATSAAMLDYKVELQNSMNIFSQEIKNIVAAVNSNGKALSGNQAISQDLLKYLKTLDPKLQKGAQDVITGKTSGWEFLNPKNKEGKTDSTDDISFSPKPDIQSMSARIQYKGFPKGIENMQQMQEYSAKKQRALNAVMSRKWKMGTDSWVGAEGFKINPRKGLAVDGFIDEDTAKKAFTKVLLESIEKLPIDSSFLIDPDFYLDQLSSNYRFIKGAMTTKDSKHGEVYNVGGFKERSTGSTYMSYGAENFIRTLIHESNHSSMLGNRFTVPESLGNYNNVKNWDKYFKVSHEDLKTLATVVPEKIHTTVHKLDGTIEEYTRVVKNVGEKEVVNTAAIYPQRNVVEELLVRTMSTLALLPDHFEAKDVIAENVWASFTPEFQKFITTATQPWARSFEDLEEAVTKNSGVLMDIQNNPIAGGSAKDIDRYQDLMNQKRASDWLDKNHGEKGSFKRRMMGDTRYQLNSKYPLSAKVYMAGESLLAAIKKLLDFVSRRAGPIAVGGTILYEGYNNVQDVKGTQEWIDSQKEWNEYQNWMKQTGSSKLSIEDPNFPLGNFGPTSSELQEGNILETFWNIGVRWGEKISEALGLTDPTGAIEQLKVPQKFNFTNPYSVDANSDIGQVLSKIVLNDLPYETKTAVAAATINAATGKDDSTKVQVVNPEDMKPKVVAVNTGGQPLLTENNKGTLTAKEVGTQLEDSLSNGFSALMFNDNMNAKAIIGNSLSQVGQTVMADAFKSLLPWANGGVVKGGFRAFANGGTVNKPTLGLVGEGKYNEAVVPLPDGKSIPVIGNAGGATENNVTVNVTIDSDGNANSDTNSGMDGDRAKQLGYMVSQAVQAELVEQKRPGGLLSSY